MNLLVRSLIIACGIATAFAACTSTPQLSQRGKEVAYQQKTTDPRLDEVLTRPHTQSANQQAGRKIARRGVSEGQSVTVNGQVIAQPVDPATGTGRQVAIRAGKYSFKSTSKEVEEILESHVGEEITVTGRVKSVEPETLVVLVDGIKILR